MILALSGGVGGAKLVQGLAAHLPADQLAVVVNTADDFEYLGLYISPDVDTVMYTLAGLASKERGWGLADETWVAHVLILPVDLPLLTGQAVDALVARRAETGADVVIAPDRWHQGTNALLLTRPFRLRPAFGPGSLARHCQAAMAQGLHLVLHTAPEFAFDLDTPEDLAAWRQSFAVVM